MFNVEVALRVDCDAHVARMDGMESGLFNLAEMQRPKYRFPRRDEVLTPISFVASNLWWPNRWTAGGCLYVLGTAAHGAQNIRLSPHFASRPRFVGGSSWLLVCSWREAKKRLKSGLWQTRESRVLGERESGRWRAPAPHLLLSGVPCPQLSPLCLLTGWKVGVVRILSRDIPIAAPL